MQLTNGPRSVTAIFTTILLCLLHARLSLCAVILSGAETPSQVSDIEIRTQPNAPNPDTSEVLRDTILTLENPGNALDWLHVIYRRLAGSVGRTDPTYEDRRQRALGAIAEIRRAARQLRSGHDSNVPDGFRIIFQDIEIRVAIGDFALDWSALDSIMRDLDGAIFYRQRDTDGQINAQMWLENRIGASGAITIQDRRCITTRLTPDPKEFLNKANAFIKGFKFFGKDRFEGAGTGYLNLPGSEL